MMVGDLLQILRKGELRFLLLVWILLAFATHACAQAPPFSLSFSLSAWKIPSIEDLRFVKTAISRIDSTDRFELHALYIEDPQQTIVKESTAKIFAVLGEGPSKRTIPGGHIQPSAGSGGKTILQFGRENRGGLYLQVDYLDAQDGNRGIRFPLYDDSHGSGTAAFFDARPYGYLTFWLRVDPEANDLSVVVADRSGLDESEGIQIQLTEKYVRDHDSTCVWKSVAIPLNQDDPGVRWGELALIELRQPSGGPSSIRIASMAFSNDPSVAVKCPAEETPTYDGHERGLGVWVWNTKTILADADERERFLSFIEKKNVSHVFLALPYESGRDIRDQGIELNHNELKPLLTRLGEGEISVEALMGDPVLTEPSHHEFVKRTILNVAMYNRSVATNARFSGVHLDVEPYLLPGFSGRRNREIVNNYVDLITGAGQTARDNGMTLAIDIPFWFDEPNEDTGVLPAVDVDGIEQPLLEVLVERTDKIVIMDYRTAPYGANGSIAHALQELRTASGRRCDVFVGLETRPFPDQEMMIFRGKPLVGFRPAISARAFLFMTEENDAAQMYLVMQNELKSFVRWITEGKIAERRWVHWPLARASTVPGSRISFWSHGSTTLNDAMDEAGMEFQAFPAFKGFGVHDYEGWIDLIENESPVQQ